MNVRNILILALLLFAIPVSAQEVDISMSPQPTATLHSFFAGHSSSQVTHSSSPVERHTSTETRPDREIDREAEAISPLTRDDYQALIDNPGGWEDLGGGYGTMPITPTLTDAQWKDPTYNLSLLLTQSLSARKHLPSWRQLGALEAGGALVPVSSPYAVRGEMGMHNKDGTWHKTATHVWQPGELFLRHAGIAPLAYRLEQSINQVNGWHMLRATSAYPATKCVRCGNPAYDLIVPEVLYLPAPEMNIDITLLREQIETQIETHREIETRSVQQFQTGGLDEEFGGTIEREWKPEGHETPLIDLSASWITGWCMNAAPPPPGCTTPPLSPPGSPTPPTSPPGVPTAPDKPVVPKPSPGGGNTDTPPVGGTPVTAPVNLNH